MAFLAPEVLFGEVAFQKRRYYVLALILIPFQPIIMCIKEEILNQKLKGRRDRTLEYERMNIRFHLRQFKRCELGIETVFQLCGQAILALYAVTETKTTEGLVKLFENDPEDKISLIGTEKAQTVFESRSFILTYLIVSTVWSCISCLGSCVGSLSPKREHFPMASQLMAYLFVFCSLLRRVFCIVMYFAIPFGLFNLLRHAQSEQAQWDLIIEKYFLDQNGYIQFGDSPKFLWASINRWNTTTRTPPSYHLYTEFGLKHYFFTFWIILIVQCMGILLVKLKLSHAFQQMTNFEKFIHVIENSNVSQCTEDWDHRSGSAMQHIKRKDDNLKEYLALSLLNHFFNFLLLVPLSILGNMNTNALNLVLMINQHFSFRVQHLSKALFVIHYYWGLA